MKKKAIVGSFSEDLNKKILYPFLTPPFGTGGTLLEKPISNFPENLKDLLIQITKDAKLDLGDFFEKLPFFFVIPHSRAINNIFFINGLGPQPVPILIFRKTKDPTTFNYINLANGTVVYAKTPEMVSVIEKGYEEEKRKAAERKKIAINLVKELDEEHDYIVDLFYNEKMDSFMKGNITNLIPAIQMLKKCYKTLEERIERQRLISKTSKEIYNQLKKNQKLKRDSDTNKAIEHPEQDKVALLFKIYEEELRKELLNPSYSKNENDLFKFMFQRYRSRSDRGDLDKDINSNLFNKATKDLGISEERFKIITDALKKVLDVFYQYEDEVKKKQQKTLTQETKEDIPSDDVIFEQMPQLTIDSFADILPGRFRGYQSRQHYISSFKEIYENVDSRKLKYFTNMQNGIQNIISIFESHLRENKTVSVCSFSDDEMKKLKEARSLSLSLFKMYRQGLLTKEGKYNKNRIGSIFETTVEDTYMFRYVAVTVRYIELVFEKNCRKQKNSNEK